MADPDKLRQEALNVLGNVQTPSIEEQKVKLEDLVRQGIITPEELKAYMQEPTAMENISVDPRFRQAQVNALQQLQDIGTQGGLTATDRAKLQDISDAQDVEERGSREAIAQQARERGIGGSDFELAQQMIAQQGAANRAARQGTDVAAQAEQNAYNALMGAGQLGGQIGEQEYARQANLAKAKDIINQFNTANQQQVAGTNVGYRNQAQAGNLSAQQQIADANTQQENENRLRNAALIQQKFANELGKATGQSNIYNQWAGEAQQAQGAKKGAAAGMLGTGLGAVGTIVGGIYGGPAGAAAGGAIGKGAGEAIGGGASQGGGGYSYTAMPISIGQPGQANIIDQMNNRNNITYSDVMAKEDIHPVDVELDDFMNTLQPYKYKYKDKSMGDGEHAGVMANDMAKTPIGAKIVIQTPKGLAIDTTKGFGVLAAALGHLNKKLNEKKGA